MPLSALLRLARALRHGLKTDLSPAGEEEAPSSLQDALQNQSPYTAAAPSSVVLNSAPRTLHPVIGNANNVKQLHNYGIFGQFLGSGDFATAEHANRSCCHHEVEVKTRPTLPSLSVRTMP